MPINATVTGSTGAGVTLTAAVFTGAARFTLVTSAGGNRSIILSWDDGRPDACIAVDSATTYTLTVSGSTFTLTIS